MGTRFHLLIHRRGPHWNCPSQLLTRYRPPRHLLRSRPLPLCIINRSSFRYYKRIHPLIPPIHRVYPPPNMNKNSIHNHILRSKPHLLPTTLPRTIWNTSTILRLPRRIHHLKSSIINWIFNFPNRCYPTNIHCMRSIFFQAKNNHT